MDDPIGRKRSLKDRGKLVDFVLAYQPSKLTETMNMYRTVYEDKLRERGLVLNVQPAEESKDKTTTFVKIRAPHSLLCTVAHNNRLQATPGQMRHWLAEFWARPGRWNKYQPLDEIRAYFGEKVAMYFAWLGFYTYMLIPLCIVGLLCFLYGFGEFERDEAMRDVCFNWEYVNRFICRACDSNYCEFHTLQTYCTYTIVNAIVENNAMVPLALFICIWSMCMLEMMKRYQGK